MLQRHERQVCMLEVVALEQDWFAGGLGKSIGKAISEIQIGGMTTLAVTAPGDASNLDLFGIDGNYFKSGVAHEEIGCWLGAAASPITSGIRGPGWRPLSIGGLVG
jgi:hypothetical protein